MNPRRLLFDKLFLIEKLVFVICWISTFLCSCDFDTSARVNRLEAPNTTQVNQKNGFPKAQDDKLKKRLQLIDTYGVKLSSLIASVSRVEVNNEPSILLKNESDKPDSVRPRYRSIKFISIDANLDNESSFSPKINIYSIREYRQAFAKSSDDVKLFDKKISLLSNLIFTKPTKLKVIPFIPFIDARPSFISHQKYVSFKNGQGLLYLTQFDIDPSIINNQGLTYIFQGFTSNNEYYILATFPVRSELLPDDPYSEDLEGYKIPNNYNDPREVDLNYTNYQNYISRIKNVLDNTNSDKFEPKLDELEETLSSLEIISYLETKK